jgi:Mg-chelatase subunit ChlD
VALARLLGAVDAISEYVRTQIRFEHYAGRLRGPQGTLQTAAGNDVDQSEPLATMLSAIGEEFRYARARRMLLSGEPVDHVWVQVRTGDEWRDLDPTAGEFREDRVSEPPFTLEYDFGTTGGQTIVATAVNALGKEATDTVTTREAPPLEMDITATVTDQGNNYILDLKQEDFLVQEDGVAQEIIRFSRELTPVSMVILLDTSGSMKRHMKAVQDAAVQFVSQIRPVDRVAVIAFADNPRVAQRFTADIGALTRVIRRTQAQGGTCLYDAVVSGCQQLQREKGRTAIILLTDGKDENKKGTGPGSRNTLEEALEMAKETGVTIYSLGLGKGVAKDVLEQLAKPTGGRAYFPPTVDDLAEGYQ